MDWIVFRNSEVYLFQTELQMRTWPTDFRISARRDQVETQAQLEWTRPLTHRNYEMVNLYFQTDKCGNNLLLWTSRNEYSVLWPKGHSNRNSVYPLPVPISGVLKGCRGFLPVSLKLRRAMHGEAPKLLRAKDISCLLYKEHCGPGCC